MERDKIDEFLVVLSNIEAEINLLRRRIALLEEEISRIKKENQRLVGELQRARTVSFNFFRRDGTERAVKFKVPNQLIKSFWLKYCSFPNTTRHYLLFVTR